MHEFHQHTELKAINFVESSKKYDIINYRIFHSLKKKHDIKFKVTKQASGSFLPNAMIKKITQRTHSWLTLLEKNKFLYVNLQGPGMVMSWLCLSHNGKGKNGEVSGEKD